MNVSIDHWRNLPKKLARELTLPTQHLRPQHLFCLEDSTDGCRVAAKLTASPVAGAWSVALVHSDDATGEAVELVLRELCQFSTSVGVRHLRFNTGVPEDTTLHRALLATDFEMVTQLHRFSWDYREIPDRYTPLLKKMQRKGRIPATARIVDRAELSLNAAKELIRREVLGGGRRLYDLGGRTYSAELSFGLTLGSRLVAASLSMDHGPDAPAECAWAAVDAEFRNDWPLIMMEVERSRRFQAYDRPKATYVTNPALDPNMLRLSRIAYVEAKETVNYFERRFSADTGSDA